MIVNFDGTIYTVNFGYTRVDKTYTKDGIVCQEKEGAKFFVEELPDEVDDCEYVTYCFIEQKRPDGGYDSIAAEKAVKYAYTPLNKHLGRKFALAKALKKINRKEFLEFRKAVWDAYFDNHKDGKKFRKIHVIAGKPLCQGA